jgi:site-specific DNA-methyltransferase (adenine-specific)
MSIYYADESVTLYHGDCREVTAWLEADVLVTDPPYGRAWRQGEAGVSRGWASDAHPGIAGDESTETRDAALSMWAGRPAIAFGDLMLPPPKGVKQVLIFRKSPLMGTKGTFLGFRRDAEAIYLLGWLAGLGGTSSVLSSNARGNQVQRIGHPHAKPLDVMETLIRRTEGVVADPFAGSGSTLVAAKRLGRKAIGVELEERYCEVIAKRLAQGVLDFGSAS